VRKFKTQNLIIIGLVFFLIILFLPFLSYTRDTAEDPNRPSSQNEVRRVNLKEVMRFSDVPEKEIYFKRPMRIKLDDNGNIYIQDRPHILKFGPDGKFLVKMIKEGQGPGEMPSGYVGSLTDFIIAKNKVIAFSSYKALWFNEKGEFQEEKKLPIKNCTDLIVTPDLNYYVFERIRPQRDKRPKVGPSKYTFCLYHISPDFKEKEVIYTWENRDGGYKFDPLCILIDSDTFIVNITSEYGFFSFDLKKGKIIKTFTRKYKRIKNNLGTFYMSDIRGFHNAWPELWVVTSARDEDKNPLIHSHDLKTGTVEEFYLKYPENENDVYRRHDGNFFAVSNGFIFTIEQTSKGFYNIVKYRME
jgi:hypothetical protein